MTDSADSKARLALARAALVASEDAHGVRSFHQRIIAPGLGPGVFEIPPSGAVLASALQEAFTDPVWVALLGVSDVGWEAGSTFGWDLERIVVVRGSNAIYADVTSSLLEGFNVVVTGTASFAPAQQRTLAGKARSLERTILTQVAWPTVSTPLVSSGLQVVHGG